MSDPTPTPDPASTPPTPPVAPVAHGEAPGALPAGVPDVQTSKRLAAAAKAKGAAAASRLMTARAAREEARLAADRTKLEADGAPKVPGPANLPPDVAGAAPDAIERCRVAVGALARAGTSVAARTLQKAAKVDMHLAAAVARAYKAGLLPPPEAPWTPGAATTGRVLPQGRVLDRLIAAVKAAKSHTQIADVSRQLAEAQLRGQIDPASSRAINETLHGGRMAIEAAAKRADALDAPDDRRMALLSATALEIAKSYDHLGDDRQEMIAGFVAEMLEQEVEEVKARDGSK